MEVNSKNQNQLEEIKQLIETKNKFNSKISFVSIFVLGLLFGGIIVYVSLKHLG